MVGGGCAGGGGGGGGKVGSAAAAASKLQKLLQPRRAAPEALAVRRVVGVCMDGRDPGLSKLAMREVFSHVTEMKKFSVSRHDAVRAARRNSTAPT